MLWQIVKMRRKCIDLFAGCGGLSLGLHAAGFDCVFAIESNEHAFETYRANLLETGLVGAEWPDWLNVGSTDIVSFTKDNAKHLKSMQGEVDLIAGGPPCQGFSLNGRRDPDDPRSALVEVYVEFVNHVRPRLVLLENVRGFVSMPHPEGGTYSHQVRRRLEAIGYDVWDDILLASDWGVPQRRPRYICIAARKELSLDVNPIKRLDAGRKSFLCERNLWPGPISVSDALSDLALNGNPPDPDPDWGDRGFTAVKRRSDNPLSPYQRLMRVGGKDQPTDRRLARHSEATVIRLKKILDTCRPGVCIRPKDRERLGIGKRCTTLLDATAPSPTVTTLPDDLVHYSDPRSLSVREHARLQSFPDWFSFWGPYTTGGLERRTACPRFTQVGNAVPPLFAEAIGETLAGLLADHELAKSSDLSEVPQ